MIKRFFFIFPLVASCVIPLMCYPAGDALAENIPVENATPDPDSRETSLSGQGIDAGRDSLLPFRCPVEKIRLAYEELASPDDLLMVMAVEKQILAVCRQTQQALLRIGENEILLRELFGTVMVLPSLQVSTDSWISPGSGPDPVFLGSGGPVVDGISEGTAVIDPVPVVIRESEFSHPDYAVAAIVKGPAGRKAMIVDGGVTYAVRPGDQMNSGGVIVDILETEIEMLWKGRTIILALE